MEHVKVTSKQFHTGEIMTAFFIDKKFDRLFVGGFL